MSSISYCVTVSTEHVELTALLNQLSSNLDPEDELIVLVDTSKITPEVSKVIGDFKVFNTIELIGSDLNKDFALFKNNFIDKATKDYIIQYDADELLSDELLTNLKPILEFNPQVDMFWVPRENYVTGITQEHIQKWGWRIDERGRINYNDPQARIFRNNKQIRWRNKLHEVLEGYKTYASLPDTHYIIHRKTIERQEQQNLFYNTL